MCRFHMLLFLLVLLIDGIQCQEPDPAQYTSPDGFPWVSVNPLRFWPWNSARIASREILSIPLGTAFNVQVTAAWGSLWNTSQNKHDMFYVYFYVRYKTFPYLTYWCRAWVHWISPSEVNLNGMPSEQYNFCLSM